MSMWLSTANRIAGSMRVQAIAQIKRQVVSAVTEGTRENLTHRPGGARSIAPKAKRRR